MSEYGDVGVPFKERAQRPSLKSTAVRALGSLGILSSLVLGGKACIENQKAAEPPSWSETMAGKLEGRIPLSSDERILENVKVVPSGKTLEERNKMEREGTEINVRDFPSTYTENGSETKVIGLISQGTIIKKVILTSGKVPNSPESRKTSWGAFELEDVDGQIHDQTGKPKTDAPKILAIYGDYLQASTQPSPAK